MGGSSSPMSDDEPIAGINVTPLVDVVLVLLVVFIVTARLVVADALPLDLPAAATGGEQQTVLVVELDASGRLAANQTVLQSVDQLETVAARARAEDPTLRAVIKADGEVPHRRVIEVMDALRRVPLSRIAFGVEATRP
jgi:biopolymer transport protein ExbD